MLKRCDGLIPIITMSASCIQDILSKNTGIKTEDDEGIIGYLVANVNYTTIIGNPQLDVIGLVAGQTKDDDGEVYPPDTEENQISIRYESIILDNDEVYEEEPIQEVFNEVLETHQIIYEYSPSCYRITCQHFIYPSQSVFKFYFPFIGYSTTFVEINETIPIMHFIPGQKPYMNIQMQNYPNGMPAQIEAQIFNVLDPNDPVIQPMVTELAVKYSDSNLKVAINNKVYKVEVRQSNDVKMYFAACSTRNEGCSINFGRIGVKTDSNYQYQQLSKKIEEQIGLAKEDIKSELKQEFQMQLKEALSDIKENFESLLKSQFDRLAMFSKQLESPGRVSEVNYVKQTPLGKQGMMQGISEERGHVAVTHGSFKKRTSKFGSNSKRIQSQVYEQHAQYQRPAAVPMSIPPSIEENPVDNTSPIPSPHEMDQNVIKMGNSPQIETGFESKRSSIKQEPINESKQSYNQPPRSNFVQDDYFATTPMDESPYSPQASLTKVGSKNKQNDYDFLTNQIDGFQFSSHSSTSVQPDGMSKRDEQSSTSSRKTKRKKSRKEGDFLANDQSLEFSVNSKRLLETLGVHT